MKNLVVLISMVLVAGCSGSSNSPSAPQGTSENPESPSSALKTIWKWADSNLLEYMFPSRSSFGDSIVDSKSGLTYIVAGIGRIDRGGGIYLFSSSDDGRTWQNKPVVATPAIRWGFSNYDGLGLAVDAASNLYLQYSAQDVSTRNWNAVILKSADQGETWLKLGEFAVADSNGYRIQKMSVLPSGTLVFSGTYDNRDGVILKFANRQLTEIDRYPGSTAHDLQVSHDGRVFILTEINGVQVIRESSDEGFHWAEWRIPLKEKLAVMTLSASGEFYVAGRELVASGACADLSIYKTKDLSGAWKKIGSFANTSPCEALRVISGTTSSSGHLHFYGSIGNFGSYSNTTFVFSSEDDGGNWKNEFRTYVGYISVVPKKIVTNNSDTVFAAANTSPGGSSVNDFFGLISIGTPVTQ